MDRHPEYKYYIEDISEENSWLYIGDKEQSGWGRHVYDTWSELKDDGPIELLLRIKEQNQWELEEVDWLQYRFKQDDIGMIFQWDDLFGLVVIIDNWNKIEEAIVFLKKYME